MGYSSETVAVQPSINGFLKHRSEWNENVASKLAEKEGVQLTDKHWDIIHYLRTEFYSNGGMVPLIQDIKLNMEQEWKTQLSDLDLNKLFPGGSNRQGAKIAGCIAMGTVRDLIKVKGDAVWSVSPDQTVIDALALMSDKNIGAVMVIEHEKLIGIISERDYTRAVVAHDHSSIEKTVRELMTDDVVAVSPDETLDQCMWLMTERGFRHLPVVEKDRVVAVLSMPDLVRIIVEQQQFTIARLESQAG